MPALICSASSTHRSDSSGRDGGRGSGSGQQKSKSLCNVDADDGRVSEKKHAAAAAVQSETDRSSSRRAAILSMGWISFRLYTIVYEVPGLYYRRRLSSRTTYEYALGLNVRAEPCLLPSKCYVV